MNNIFNLNRFLLLFKKHTIEHGKTYLLSTAVLAGILLLMLGFISYADNGYLNTSVQSLVFMWIMLAGGCIFTSLSFTALGDKKQAISLLTLPASHFEKYLVSWLYSYVIFQLVFTGAFYLVDFIVINCGKPPRHDGNELINIFSYTTGRNDFFYPFIIYALLHSITFWGSVFFDKMHFIKTAFVFFIFIIAISFTMVKLQELIIAKDVSAGPPFLWINVRDAQTHQYWRISTPNSMVQVGKITLALTVAVLWASAFFRLKEKEV